MRGDRVERRGAEWMGREKSEQKPRSMVRFTLIHDVYGSMSCRVW